MNTLKLLDNKIKGVNRSSSTKLLCSSRFKKLVNTTGSNYINKITSLIGFNKLSSIQGFAVLLKKRENSIRPLLSSKSKKNFTLRIKAEQAWAFLKNNKFYKGIRFSKGYPVRGQRTHTNAKTVKKNN